MNNNTNNTNNIDNNIYLYDLYDLYTIEYSNLILNLYDEINEYSNSHHINCYNMNNVGSFINLIYNNIDYENSSIILSSIIKNTIREQELYINESDDYCKDDDFY